MSSYFCSMCQTEHVIFSPMGATHLKEIVSKEEIALFLDLASSIAAWEMIVNGIPHVLEGTHQYVRDIQVAQLLQRKFPNMPYGSAEGFKIWLQERLAISPQSGANALSRIQGDAGEVDFVRKMGGSLRSVFTKTDYATDVAGNITNNVPRIDVIERTRILGHKVAEYQVKTLRTEASIPQTLKDFLDHSSYSKDTVLVGPKELIEAAKEQNLPNPTRISGTIEQNARSVEALQQKILDGKFDVAFTPKAVLGKVAGGVVIGAAVSITINSFISYLDYRNGKITREEMVSRIKKEGIKGGVTGGALAGLSLVVPGGIIGLGVGCVVGSALRRILDEGFGDGLFGEVLELNRSILINMQLMHEGALYVGEIRQVQGKQMAAMVSVCDDLSEEHLTVHQRLASLEKQHHPRGMIINSIEGELDKRLEAIGENRSRMGELLR